MIIARFAWSMHHSDGLESMSISSLFYHGDRDVSLTCDSCSG